MIMMKFFVQDSGDLHETFTNHISVLCRKIYFDVQNEVQSIFFLNGSNQWMADTQLPTKQSRYLT